MGEMILFVCINVYIFFVYIMIEDKVDAYCLDISQTVHHN